MNVTNAKPTGPQSTAKVKILCVDDEPYVLEGMLANLGRKYEVQTATSGAAALQLLTEDPGRAVIISDMRMPAMDGATFLAKARVLAPDAVRVLLTGQADVESAISAVNEGQIFRFLTKPCSPPNLLAAIATAVEQHQLITAQRVLLEQTLHGSIRALTEVLSLTNPTAFGRATRIKQLVSQLAEHLELRERWQVEIAAMLSQLGHITLPPETAEKAYYGNPLTKEEQRLMDNLPSVTEQLLGGIPRLETVRGILSDYARPHRGSEKPNIHHDVQYAGAQLLRIAVDFDALEAHGALALDKITARPEHYDPAALAALVAVRGQSSSDSVRDVSLSQLVAGMVLAEDVKLSNGVLLAARGHEVTDRFLERMRNSGKGALTDQYRIAVRSPGAASWWAAPSAPKSA
jgi:response regulator RpfG family c-di-GMP phosphodiesterase